MSRYRDPGALEAAMKALDNLPQYKNQQSQVGGTNQQAPVPFSDNNQTPQPQQPTMGQTPPGMDGSQYQVMKLFHLLSGLSYEMYGDPNKWQENHVEAFFEEIKGCIKKSKTSSRVNKSKMTGMMKRNKR